MTLDPVENIDSLGEIYTKYIYFQGLLSINVFYLFKKLGLYLKQKKLFLPTDI